MLNLNDEEELNQKVKEYVEIFFPEENKFLNNLIKYIGSLPLTNNQIINNIYQNYESNYNA